MQVSIDDIIPFSAQKTQFRPYFDVSVSAGRPCAAEQDNSTLIDLNEHLITHPKDTYFVRVQGDSMLNAGIHDGDMLVVDRAIQPKDGHIVVAILEGEFTVKRVQLHNKGLSLLPENPAYHPIDVTSDMQFEVWGVVTNVIHALA